MDDIRKIRSRSTLLCIFDDPGVTNIFRFSQETEYWIFHVLIYNISNSSYLAGYISNQNRRKRKTGKKGGEGKGKTSEGYNKGKQT